MMPSRFAIVAFLAYLLLAVSVQVRTRAYETSWSGHSDEGPHYVTGMMVRDFLTSGSIQPKQYALSYYQHYPKVGLGHWPPAWYILQTTIALLFGPGRTALFLLIALLSALTAAVVRYIVLENLSGSAWYKQGLAGLSGVLLLTLPGMRYSIMNAGPEAMLILSVVLALVCWGRFLDDGDWRQSGLFGILATAALLTKGTGVQVAPVAVGAVLLAGRWKFLRSPAFFLPLLPVLLVALPWYLFIPGAQHEAVGRFGVTDHAPIFWRRTSIWATPWLPWLAAATAGLAVAAVRPNRRGTLLCLLIQLPALLALSTFISAWEPRNMQALFPAVAIGIALLFHQLGKRLRLSPATVLAIAALASGAGAWHWRRVPLKPDTGVIGAEARLRAEPGWQRSVVLVVGDPALEGQFTAEVVMNDPVRPGRTVLRASKLMAHSSFMGRDYVLTLKTPAEVDSLLRNSRLDYVVIEGTAPDSVPHHVLTAEVLAADPAAFEPLGSFPASGRVRLYRVHGNDGGSVPSQAPNIGSARR